MDWQKWINLHKFVIHKKPGRFAEWLGAGLQNQLQRFESATDLPKIPFRDSDRGLFIYDRQKLAFVREIINKTRCCVSSMKGDFGG